MVELKQHAAVARKSKSSRTWLMFTATANTAATAVTAGAVVVFLKSSLVYAQLASSLTPGRSMGSFIFPCVDVLPSFCLYFAVQSQLSFSMQCFNNGK